MAVDRRSSARHARLKEAAVALLVGAVVAAGAAVAVRYIQHRNEDKKVSSTLHKVKADAVAIRGAQWDRVRSASLLGGPGGIVDTFKDVGRPNRITYEGDRITVEVRTGVDGSRGCITARLGRDSATFATTRCTPARD